MNILYRYLGYILLISAIFRVLPLAIALIYKESLLPFLITIGISVALGYLFVWLGNRSTSKAATLHSLNIPQAFMLVAITFIILPAISAIAFLPSMQYNFLNAFFESISGFTTTGLTMYPALEHLPKSLLMWRAETQWLGGIGIVMVFLFIISRLTFHGKEETTKIDSTVSLYHSQGFAQKLESNLQKSSKNVLIIYGSYTLAGIAALYLTGKSLFESTALSFTALSTGGFIVTDSLQISTSQLIILCTLMLLGSISFITHNKLLQGKFKAFILSKEKNIFLLIIAIAIVLTLLVYSDIKTLAFEMISAFTTTGFSLSVISTLPHLFIMLMVTGMLIGGSVASTTGGIKIARLQSLLAMIPWVLKKLRSPRHAIIPLRIDDKVVEENDQFIVVVFVSLFFIMLFAGTLVLLLLGYNFLDSIFQMASALGTVGLQTIDLAALPGIGKLLLIVAMLMGRLEIFPLLLVVRQVFKRN